MDKRLLSITGSSSGSCDPSEPVLPVFACNICSFGLPPNPVETACGHLFCWPCMHRFLQGQAKPCPVCATMLSSDVNVAPMATNYGSLMLFLPTTEEYHRSGHIEDDLDALSTNNTVLVPRPRANLRRRKKEETPDVLLLYMGNKRIRKQAKRLQRRVRQAKRLLRKSKREDTTDVQIPEGKTGGKIIC